MIFGMSKAADTKYGPALVAYLRQLWADRDTNQTEWSREHKFEGSNFGHWGAGTSEPRFLETYRWLADELGISAVTLLHGIGFLTDAEAKDKTAKSLDELIDELPDGNEKRFYLNARDLAEQFQDSDRDVQIKQVGRPRRKK